MATRFEPAAGRWAAGLGGVRDVVRQELVRRQVAAVARPGDRVLDAGCGQGTQALHLARAGHQVVGLDASADLLARFGEALDREPPEVRARVGRVEGLIEDAPALTDGSFDLVLCHGVLMYAEDPAALLAALDEVAGPDARLSVLVRNGLAPAMRAGLLGRWTEALAAFDTLDYVNRLGLPARAHTPDEVDHLVGPGWRRTTWSGVRVLTDHLGGEPPDPAVLPELLAAEAEAGRRDPYRRVAALLHLVYERPAR